MHAPPPAVLRRLSIPSARSTSRPSKYLSLEEVLGVGNGGFGENGVEGTVYLSSTHGGTVPLPQFLRDNPPILPNGEFLSRRSNDHRRENNRSQ